MKTPEEIRDAVLAECKRICDGKQPFMSIDIHDRIFITEYDDKYYINEWLYEHGKRYANAYLCTIFKEGQEHWGIAYRLLGLEARDERERQRLDDAAVIGLGNHTIQMLMSNIKNRDAQRGDLIASLKAIEAATHGRGNLEAGMEAIRAIASQAIDKIEKGEQV